MMVLDTSFLVSLFISKDANHASALELFEKKRSEELLLTDVILFETLSVINKKEGMEWVRTAYSELLANSKLTLVYLSEEEKKEIVAEFLVQEGNLSIADISVVHSCRKTLSKAMAFDKELLRKVKAGSG